MPKSETTNTTLIGWHYYPTVENEHYLSGTADIYYGYQEYHEARATWLLTGNYDHLHEMDSLFFRVQYVIYKNNGVPSDMILLHDRLVLDWDREFEDGLDSIIVRHRWLNAPSLDGAYRFSAIELKPIGPVKWTAPDLFHWHKPRKAA